MHRNNSKNQDDIRTRLVIDNIVLGGVGWVGFMSMLAGSDRVIAQMGVADVSFASLGACWTGMRRPLGCGVAQMGDVAVWLGLVSVNLLTNLVVL